MASKRFVVVVFVALAILLAVPGCAYRVYVRGVLEESPSPDFRTGATIGVQPYPHAAKSDLTREIARKIERLVAEKGYEVVSPTDASFMLFFDFEWEGLLEKRVLEPIAGPTSGIATTRREGPFVHTLSVSVVEAESYRGDSADKVETVWAGGAVINNTPVHAPKIVDLLLVAAFKHFGEDTGRTVETRMFLNDRRTRALRAP